MVLDRLLFTGCMSPLEGLLEMLFSLDRTSLDRLLDSLFPLKSRFTTDRLLDLLLPLERRISLEGFLVLLTPCERFDSTDRLLLLICLGLLSLCERLLFRNWLLVSLFLSLCGCSLDLLFIFIFILSLEHRSSCDGLVGLLVPFDSFRSFDILLSLIVCFG